MTVTLSEDLNPIQLRFRSFLGWDRKECCASASAEAALADSWTSALRFGDYAELEWDRGEEHFSGSQRTSPPAGGDAPGLERALRGAGRARVLVRLHS